MIVKLLTEPHLEFLSLTRGCRGSSESTLVKMSDCWQSHATAQIEFKCHKTVDSFSLISNCFNSFKLIKYKWIAHLRNVLYHTNKCDVLK